MSVLSVEFRTTAAPDYSACDYVFLFVLTIAVWLLCCSVYSLSQHVHWVPSF